MGCQPHRERYSVQMAFCEDAGLYAVPVIVGQVQVDGRANKGDE